jgi:phosphoribosylanthranilate isomerase
MTKIKLCGLSRICDIEAANRLKPEYIGFVFLPKSKRYVTYEKAKELKSLLSPDIKAVGVLVDESAEIVARLLNDGTIDIAQLHGGEDEDYISRLRKLTGKPIIKAFRIESEEDIARAEKSSADHILLDSGMGTGKVFDWSLIQSIKRPYFLAGGLDCDNVGEAIKKLRPYAVDVSSGIETNGLKDKEKMAAFVAKVRKEC